jgi:hypothetical protein
LPAAILPEHREIVEDPEGPAVGRGHQVSLLDRQIVHRHRRQILLEPLPVTAIVEGDPHPSLGAGVQQPLPNRVFPDHPGELGSRIPVVIRVQVWP